MKKWQQREIRRLKARIEELEDELEYAQGELLRLEGEGDYLPPKFNEILARARDVHPVAKVTRYKGFGDIDSPEFRMQEEAEEIPWTRYYREVRQSALTLYGIKRIPRCFILSQFKQDVPPETAAQIAKKNMENGYLRAVIIDNTHSTQ